jgi:hypothetical protein
MLNRLQPYTGATLETPSRNPNEGDHETIRDPRGMIQSNNGFQDMHDKYRE